MKRIDETYVELFGREDGGFFTTGGYYHRLWVPLQVALVPFPYYLGYYHYEGFPGVQFPELRGNCSALQFLRGKDEPREGWRQKTDTATLLHDFLRLAHEDTAEKQVLKFAEQWGPLWRCRQDICSGEFPPCYAYMNNGDYCYWSSCEPVREYILEAKRAKNVLDALILLRNHHKPVPASLWDDIQHVEMSEWWAQKLAEWEDAHNAKYGLTRPVHDHEAELERKYPDYAINKGWQTLIDMVNKYIVALGRSEVCLVYDDTSSQARLHMVSSLGFLNIVWIEIVRAITMTSQWYICDGCDMPYERKKRRPKPGQKNYCQFCAEEGYKPTKKAYKDQQKVKK